MEKLIETFFSFMCHQDKDILISVYDKFIPLCPRCIGLQVGFFISPIIFFFNRCQNLFLNTKIRFTLIILTSLAGLHWLLGGQEIVTPDSLSRFITGFFSGSGFGILLISFTRKIESYYFNQRKKVIIKFSVIILLIVSGILVKEVQLFELALFTIVLNNIYIIGYSLTLLKINHIKLQKQEVVK